MDEFYQALMAAVDSELTQCMKLAGYKDGSEHPVRQPLILLCFVSVVNK